MSDSELPSDLGAIDTKPPRFIHRLPESSRHALKDLGRVKKRIPGFRDTAEKLGDEEQKRINFTPLDGIGSARIMDISETLQTELRDPITIKVNDGEEEQDIRYLFLNRERTGPDTPITVYFPGITDSVSEGKMAHLAGRTLAHTLGAPLIVFDIPPFGGSGDFTAKQKLELDNNEGMGEIAKSHLRALKQIFEDAKLTGKEVNLVGYSFGAFIASEVARLSQDEEFGFTVRNLIQIESPGVENLKSKKELLTRMLSKAHVQEQDLYTTIPYDSTLRRVQNQDHSTPVVWVKSAQWIKRNFKKAWKLGGVLSRNFVPVYIETAIKRQADLESLSIYGSGSTISSERGHKDMENYLNGVLDPSERARLHSKKIPGATHPAFLNVHALTEEVREGLVYLEGARAARNSTPAQ